MVAGGCEDVPRPVAPVAQGAAPRPIVLPAFPEDGGRFVGGGIGPLLLSLDEGGRHEPIPALREVSMGTKDSEVALFSITPFSEAALSEASVEFGVGGSLVTVLTLRNV